MRKTGLYIGVALLFLNPLYGELTVSKIEKMVEQIQLKRVSKIDIDFAKTPSPFVMVAPETNTSAAKIVTPEEEIKLKLGGIVNDAAFINDKWVRVGEEVEECVVENITENMVILRKGERYIRLFLNKKSDLLQINEGNNDANASS